jgi:hypothetical protein
LLDIFTRARQCDAKARLQAVEFERKSHFRHESERTNEEHTRDAARTTKKPRLTGGYLRPTLYNVPLPRMRNQPLEISMMISKRVKARARRQAAQAYWLGILEDLRTEALFERDAWKGEGKTATHNLCYSRAKPPWGEILLTGNAKSQAHGIFTLSTICLELIRRSDQDSSQ